MRLVRWVPKTVAPDAVAMGLTAHNKSALWVFDLDQKYRPSDGITHDAVLLKFIFKNGTDETVRQSLMRQTIDFEDGAFKGESAHPRHNIVKSNEPGAYGLGAWRQACTRFHLKTVIYASREEVAAALNESVRSKTIIDKHMPPKGWPK